jgi:hypothetical protein
LRKLRDGVGGPGDRFTLQSMRCVETVAEARLFTVLAERHHQRSNHISDEQLYGIGADIDDGATALTWHARDYSKGWYPLQVNSG